MAKGRSLLLAALAAVVVTALIGCETLQGDRDVDTSDGEGGVDKSPGLFTGKKGAIIFETDAWEGASPYGDSEE